MKKLVLLFGITWGIFSGSQAQNEIATTTPLSSKLLLAAVSSKSIFCTAAQPMSEWRVRKSPEHYQKLKRAGIVLTSVGIASLAGGIALITVGNNENNSGYGNTSYMDTTPGDDKIMAGVLGIAGSLPALGGGITMWAIGNNRLKKYADKVHISAGVSTAIIAYRF